MTLTDSAAFRSAPLLLRMVSKPPSQTNLTMRVSSPYKVTRRSVITLLLSLPISTSAKILVADPEALSRITKTESGLQYFDITIPSSGPQVKSFSTVTVHYVLGTTGARNGWRIDSSYEHDPLTFTVGQSDVIHGLEEGVLGMREGGVRRLLIPPQLGYHSGNDRPIPIGFAAYQRFKNVYLNKDRIYQPDVVIDVTILKVR